MFFAPIGRYLPPHLQSGRTRQRLIPAPQRNTSRRAIKDLGGVSFCCASGYRTLLLSYAFCRFGAIKMLLSVIEASKVGKVVDCRGFIHSWSTMYLLDLPPELLIPVLAVATAIHPIPAHVLVLSKFIYSIAAPILYRHPSFSSISALALFPPVIWGSDTVGKPSTITVDLAGADVGRGAFRGLWRLLSRTRFPRDVTNLTTRLELEDLRLRLHSTSDGDADDQSLQALDFVE